jgi:hypothetical protein
MASSAFSFMTEPRAGNLLYKEGGPILITVHARKINLYYNISRSYVVIIVFRPFDSLLCGEIIEIKFTYFKYLFFCPSM